MSAFENVANNNQTLDHSQINNLDNYELTSKLENYMEKNQILSEKL